MRLMSRKTQFFSKDGLGGAEKMAPCVHVVNLVVTYNQNDVAPQSPLNKTRTPCELSNLNFLNQSDNEMYSNILHAGRSSHLVFRNSFSNE